MMAVPLATVCIFDAAGDSVSYPLWKGITVQIVTFSLRRLLGSLGQPKGRIRGRKSGRLMEALEARTLLSGSVDAGVLTLVGSAGSDRISIAAGANAGEVIVNGVQGVEKGHVFTGVDN